MAVIIAFFVTISLLTAICILANSIWTAPNATLTCCGAPEEKFPGQNDDTLHSPNQGYHRCWKIHRKHCFISR